MSRFAVIDMDMTGFSPAYPRVIEVGLVFVDDCGTRSTSGTRS